MSGGERHRGTPPAPPAVADEVRAMFDRIAPRYDLLNRLMSLGTDRYWRARAVRAMKLRDGDRALDLATGTADLAIAIAAAHPGVEVVGVDFALRMLARGRAKAKRAGVGDRVRLVRAPVEALPFAGGQFAAAAMAFGIRNVPDRVRAMREVRRVLRRGGRFVVLELGEPEREPLRTIVRAYCHAILPRLGALLSDRAAYTYLPRSVSAFPSREAFAAEMQAAGFDDVEVEPLRFGVATIFVGR